MRRRLPRRSYRLGLRIGRTWARRHDAAERLWQGSGRLAYGLPRGLIRWLKTGKIPTRLGRWIAGADSGVEKAIRITAVVLLGGVVLWIAWRILRALPTMWVLAAAWLLGAWRAGKGVTAPAPEVAVERVQEQPTAPPSDGLRRLLTHLIGTRTGVHLADVVTHLQQTGQQPNLTVPQLRSRLDALGIPVRRSLKVGGAVRMGVHRDDFPAPSPAGRPPGAQPAGEPADLQQQPSSTG